MYKEIEGMWCSTGKQIKGGIHMNEKEVVLIRKAKQGDVEAFESLIMCYQKKVFNIAYRIIGNYDDAGELAQEVFIRVFKSLKQLREDQTFYTWLSRITTNICLDECRKRKNKKTVYLDEEIGFGDNELKIQVEDCGLSPEILAERNEVRRNISEAMQILSDEQREVIVMRYMRGLSYDEMAEAMNCPCGTVKSRINRAKQYLKEVIEMRMGFLIKEYVH
jgi:RNA polymerase sigma-70 factor (ECF subfamily)